MLHYRNVLLVCLGILLASGPLAAEVLHVVGSGDVKPPDPDYVYQKAPFDCTPLQTLNLSPGLAGFLANDTTGGTNLIDSYPCAPWQERGPEHIYQLEVAAGDTLEFWAGLVTMDPPIDHDLFLLNGCDTDSCLIGDNTEFTAQLTGGTYYLIIDGASGSPVYEGPYQVNYSCRYVGVAPIVCSPGYATEVDFNQAGPTFDDNLFGQYDAVRSFDCSPILLRGGEKWYTLTLPAAEDNQFGGRNFSEFEVEFTALYPTLDVALWLFDGCGIHPTCLDYVNNFAVGGESLKFRNETTQEMKVYLAVDCFRAPSEAGTGGYTLKFTNDIAVPTEKTSFGSLRALYR
jgi:hypothetical protein